MSAAMGKRILDAMQARPSLILQNHRAEVIELALKHHAFNVRVFGSVARGEDRPGSDIDLLVTFGEDASLYDQSALILDLQELTGIGVDVVSEGGLRAKHARILAEAVPV